VDLYLIKSWKWHFNVELFNRLSDTYFGMLQLYGIVNLIIVITCIICFFLYKILFETV